MSDVQYLRTALERQKGMKEQTEKLLEQCKQQIVEKNRDLRRHEQAREIIREVGMQTQKTLQFHISEITSLALDAVFDNPYKLVAEFVQRRNRSECDLYFDRDKNRVDPLSASGGGAVDVASFALRVASWSMQSPRSRNTLILDEPFRFLSENLLPKASEMLQQIAKQLGLQIIMVTHSEELMEAADKIFEVSISNGISEIRNTR